MSEFSETCILLAEDNPADVMPVEHALKEHAVDCTLVVMRDGAEALRFFRDLDVDSNCTLQISSCLISICRSMDGEEIIRRVRASERCAGTRVVVMSSSDNPKDRVDARHSALYFRKPAGLDAFMELGTVVKQALAEERRERRS